MKEFIMVHVTCATKYQYKPFPDDPETFHQVLSVMLILVLVLKDFIVLVLASLVLVLVLVIVLVLAGPVLDKSYALI